MILVPLEGKILFTCLPSKMSDRASLVHKNSNKFILELF